MNPQRDYDLDRKPACVLASGPEEGADGEAEYCVCFGDDEGDPICSDKRAIWYLWDIDEVNRFVNSLCAKHGLENVNEAMAP